MDNLASRVSFAHIPRSCIYKTNYDLIAIFILVGIPYSGSANDIIRLY
jgi:hypothetical protein